MYFVTFIYYYFLDYVTSELGLGKEPDLTNIDSVMFMFTLTWVDLFSHTALPAGVSGGPPRVPLHALTNVVKSGVGRELALTCDAQAFPLPTFR